MTMFGVTPVAIEQVLQLDGKRYFLASSAQASQMEGVRRSWEVKRVPRQEGDPSQEFTVPLTSFHNGYGYTFSGESGVYEMAAGWDLSAPGRAVTYPRLTTADPVTSDNYRGWIYWNATSGYMYMLRGSYATKYQVDDTSTSWPILERHYFGASIVVAGKPAEFQGKLYVPLVDISVPGTETLARWHELTTFATTIVETQVLTESGTPTGGTFVLRFADGLTTTDTSALAYNISAADMQTALRLIPALNAVTVTRSGASNFVWTVVMTGAPSVLAGTSPPQFTLQTNSLTGGSSPTITPSTSVAGTGDTWTRSDNVSVAARTFTTWQKPTVGPVLVRASANVVATCAATPTTAANWATAQEVGDTGAKINALTTLGRLLFVGKDDGVWSFDETGQAVNEIPAIAAVRDSQNCIGMIEYNGYLMIPHKLGLIRWRPGSSWGIVGAEQEGLFEGDRSTGWGAVAGLAPYGKYCYQTLNDLYDGLGVIGSLQAPGGPRGSLTPHMHQSFDSFVEDVAIVGISSQPITGHYPNTWSDDNAVGTITWSNTANAGLAGVYASAASGGTTHYLKGLNPNPVVPTAAIIKGIKVESTRLAVAGSSTVTTKSYTGAAQTYVVPAGVTSISVLVYGAQGGNYSGGTVGGKGALNSATIAVTPAETLDIIVGGQGGSGDTGTGAAGYGGGAAGGDNSSETFQGAGGGGASYISRSGTKLVVAGGGGGAAAGLAGGAGGLTGEDGNAVAGGYATAGGGGTASAGGSGGAAQSGTSATAGAAGSLGAGGAGGNGDNPAGATGGGGGGGYYGGGGGGGGGIAASGGGGSSYGPAGLFAYIVFDGYQSGNGQIVITATVATDIVDSTVKLVKAGSVVGTNLAAAGQWAQSAAVKVYGGANELWGTTWTAAEVNASTFGVVFSDTVTTGTAQRGSTKMYVYYTVSGVSDPGSFVAVITLDSTRTIATPYIYRAPRAGLPAANDPNIDKATSGASFKTARYTAPSRNTQKIYRSVEFYVDLDPQVNTPGLQVWVSVEDGTAFPLLDANGDSATITVSGSYELFFPQTAQAVGRWAQLIPTVPAIVGDQVAVAVDLREITLHGAWLPKMTEEVQAVLVLKEGGQFEDNTTETRTVAQQLDDLDALNDPRGVGDGVVTLRDPVKRTTGTCIVQEVSLKPIRFKAANEDTWVATVTLRKSVYE